MRPPASSPAWSRSRPACGAVDLIGAIAIGAVAGAACAYAVGLKFRFRLDDSLDVVGVHLVGGIIGTLLIGLFSTSAGAGGVNGLFYGGGFASLGDQALGALIAIVWSGFFTAIIGVRHQVHDGLAHHRGRRGQRHRPLRAR